MKHRKETSRTAPSTPESPAAELQEKHAAGIRRKNTAGKGIPPENRRESGPRAKGTPKQAKHRRKKAQADPAPQSLAPRNGREIFRHGGCEVLRLEYCVPEGGNAAARHAAALSAELCAFVREALVKEATETLETAVSQGCGYRFSRYVCRVNGKITRKKSKETLVVSFEVSAGNTLLHHAVQESVWEEAVHACGTADCPPK